MEDKPDTRREFEAPNFKPTIVILISGKRKSGKDYLTTRLQNRVKELGSGIASTVIHIANPIKHYWAAEQGLNYEKLLDSSCYKEQHRLGMANWSVEYRTQTIGYFCRESILMAEAVGKPIWICADMRHTQDLNWFFKYYPGIVKRVRVVADEKVRKLRGWIFTKGIDDGPTECELDYITDWDLIIQNNFDSDDDRNLETALVKITSWIKAAMINKP